MSGRHVAGLFRKAGQFAVALFRFGALGVTVCMVPLAVFAEETPPVPQPGARSSAEERDPAADALALELLRIEYEGAPLERHSSDLLLDGLSPEALRAVRQAVLRELDDPEGAYGLRLSVGDRRYLTRLRADLDDRTGNLEFTRRVDGHFTSFESVGTVLWYRFLTNSGERLMVYLGASSLLPPDFEADFQETVRVYLEGRDNPGYLIAKLERYSPRPERPPLPISRVVHGAFAGKAKHSAFADYYQFLQDNGETLDVSCRKFSKDCSEMKGRPGRLYLSEPAPESIPGGFEVGPRVEGFVPDLPEAEKQGRQQTP